MPHPPWPVPVPPHKGVAQQERDIVRDRIEQNELLTPTEVAELFRVNPKTVTRWAKTGKITAIRTLGGHRRFNAKEILRFLEEQKVS